MFQSGDRIEWANGQKADVVRVSKDGSRLYIAMWMGEGSPRRARLWIYAKSARLVRAA